MRHKKFNKGRILALFLAFTMLISGFPAVALGETLSPTPITSIEWVFEVSSAEFEVMGAYLEEPSPYAEEEASYQNTYEENSTAELASEGPTAEDFTSEEMSSDDESIEEDPSEEGSSEDIDSEEIDSEEINSEEISSEEEYSSDEHSDETYSDESESDDLQDDDTLAPPSITLSNVQGVVGNVGGFHFTLPCETRFITEYGEIRIAANLQGMEFAGLVNMGEIYVSDSNLNVTLTSIIINEHVLVGIEILQSIAPFGFYDFPPGATMYFSDTLAESEDGAAWLERDGDLILFFTIQPLDAPDGVIYDLTLDNTLGALPANIADHAIFRAPSGGALSGVNATSVSLTGRDSNAQGIDICLVKLHALLTPDMEYRFEIAGTAGVPSSSSQAARLVRPGVTDGPPTINHAITSTGAGGVFSFDITLSYDTIAEHASAGSMIYRIGTNSGDTNNQDIIVTTLRITEIEVDDDTNDFGYIFNLQHYIATLPDGPLGAGGAGTTTLGTTHGVANTNLSLGVAGANRFLLVDRTQTNATRGLLLQGIDFQVGDIITIEGNLLTAGLDMRIQGQSAPNNMPDVEYLNRVGGDDQGPFRMEYTMTQTLIDGGVSGGLRILAHNSGIYSQFRLYGLTVYRPDPNAAVFVPGPQIFNSITYEFNVTGVTEPTTITFPDGQFQLRQNNPAAGILQPSSRAFTVSDNGTHLWDVPFGTPAGGGFIGWSNMGENHTITGSAAQFAFEAVIIDGVRLEPTGVHTLLSGSGQLPSAFQHASEHIFAECSCGNSRLVRLDGRSTTIDHPDFPSVNLTQLRNLVMFIQDENLDGCHVPFTWGQLGGPPLYSATNATTFRGDDATIVHTGASANNDPHVLRLSGVALTESDREAIRNAENSLLAVTHTAQMTGNRAIWVWTDLSGTVPGASGNPAQLSFLTNANHDANAVIRTATIGPAEIEVPIDLLYRPSAVPGGSGTFAEHIYILTTLASSSGHSTLEDFLLAGNLRRDLTASITHASLQFVAAPTFIRNISLNVGVNQSEMRFTWWTERSATAAENATNSVVQIVRYADLVGGEMPPSPREIMGHAPVPIDSNLPQYAYNVSRANVTGITPNTRYAYRVGNLVGGEMEWSPIHHFDSFAPNDGHTVLLVGDPQIGAWSLMRQWNKWQNSLTDAFTRVRTMYTQNGVGHGGVDFILSAGDNSTPANNMERFHIFMQPYQLRNTPMFTTIGNHDTVTQHAGDAFDRIALLSYAYYWPNHDWLRAGATLVDGVVTGGTPGRSTHESNYVRGGGNHFFVYGDVLYISLNMNLVGAAGIAQHRETLRQATTMHPNTTWRIATFHQDIFGSGTGHAAGMPASNRQMLGYELNYFGIDLVINGHEHTHGRSYFMDGRAPVMQQRPADFGRNRDERLIYDAHPGAFIAPDGIPYITLGSISDFPKYTSIFPMLSWVAWTDPPELDNMAQYSIMVVDGDSITIETWAIPYDTATWTPSGEPEFMSTSFTIRQTARFEDLQLLISGANALPRGDISQASWDAFHAAVSSAQGLTAASSATAIHNAYMLIYDRYFELETDVDNSALDALVQEVAAKLGVAVEGPWFGQFPPGSINILREVFDVAEAVNALRLSTQDEINEQYDLLRAAFEHFLSLASPIPRPWIDVHNIPATGVYNLGLLNWMDDSSNLGVNWEGHPNVTPRFFAHHTKLNFAGGSLRNAAGANHHTNFIVPRADAIRPDEPYGPANVVGGRYPIPFGNDTVYGHITHTHAGEWVRYELNVAQAGEYRVQLGAINPQSAPMQVILRDTNYNTLTRFIIPAGHGVAQGWDNAPMIAASNNINLPQGRFILEMVFINDGVTGPTHHGTGNVSSYPDGPNVDLITLERVGNTNPDIVPIQNRPDNAFVLPLPPNDAAGNALRQRGWSMAGTSNEWGTVVQGAFTHAEVSATTHLVFEVAGRPSGNVDVVLAGGHSGTWTQVSVPMGDIFDPDTGLVTIDFGNLPRTGGEPPSPHGAFELWRDVSDGAPRRIIVSHNSESWDELNVITAYLLLDDTYVPPDPDCDCDDPDCEECNPPIVTTEVVWELDITQSLVDDLNNNETHDNVMAADSPAFTYSGGNLVVSDRTSGWFSLDILLAGIGLTVDGAYRITVEGSTTGTEVFLLHFPLDGTNDNWNTPDVLGTGSGAVMNFTSEVPNIGGATPGVDSENNCQHRIRVRTSGTGDFTIYSIVIERLLDDDEESDSNSNYESDTETDSDSGYESDTETDSDSDYESDTEIDSDSDYESDTETESDSDYESDTETDSDSDYESDAESDSDSDDESDTESDSDSESGTGGGGTPSVPPGRPPTGGYTVWPTPQRPSADAQDDEDEAPSPQAEPIIDIVIEVDAEEIAEALENDEDLEIVVDIVTVIIPNNVINGFFPDGEIGELAVAIVLTPRDTVLTDAIFALTVRLYVDDSEITATDEPVIIKISLYDIDLEGVNATRIVAITEGGTVIGGVFDPSTGMFIFEASFLGDFEIIYIETLRRLLVTIGSYTITDLAGNAPVQIMDVAPLIVDGRTLLPVRFLANALGGEITWNEALRQVTITKYSASLILTIDQTIPGMDVPAILVEGRTMVPARFISEFFGALVKWNEDTRSFEIIL